MASARAAAPRTAPPLPPNGRLLTSLGEHDDRREPVHLGERHGRRTRCCRRGPSACRPRAAPCVSRSSAVTPSGSVSDASCRRRCRPPEESPRTSPSASIGDDRAVRHAQRRAATQVADARGPGGARPGCCWPLRAGGSWLDQLVELGGDDRGACSASVAARRVDRGAAREPGGRPTRGEHEDTERDRDHRDEQPRPETPRAVGSRRGLAGLGGLEPVADTAHGA